MVEDRSPRSTVSQEQGQPGSDEMASHLALLQRVKLGQSWKSVNFAPGIRAGMEWT